MNIDRDPFEYDTNNHISNNLVVIDSEHRDTAKYPKTGSFTIDLEDANQAPFRDVLAIKLINFNLHSPAGPLDTVPVYLKVNDYRHLITGTSKIPYAFSQFVASTSNITFTNTTSPIIAVDPYTYIPNPVIGNLRKFDISLVKSDGTLFDTKDAKLSLGLSVYTKRNKFTRA